jgi:hypothetical protein
MKTPLRREIFSKAQEKQAKQKEKSAVYHQASSPDYCLNSIIYALKFAREITEKER